MAEAIEHKSGITERHIQTIGAAIIIALVLWVGNSVSTNTAALATLAERSKNQTSEITEMKQALAASNISRYTRDDANRDLGIIHGRLKALEQRVGN